MEDWLGAPWSDVAYVAATTVLMYCSAVLAVRLAGRRTVMQLSAFDIIVTIAFGSVIATTVVSRDASYAHGLTAMGTLLALQVGAAAMRLRFKAARRILDFPPRVMFRDGRFDASASPLGPQMTYDELLSLLRQDGVFDTESVRLVILEPTGGLSIHRR